MSLTKTLWSSITSLVSTGKNVSDSLDIAFANIDTAIEEINSNTSRITSLEASHDLILVASSTATTQQPTVVDSPIQVEFGVAQTHTDIDLSVDGSITFNIGGKFILSPFFQYGRSGSTGTSELLNRYLINGSQIGSSLAAKIDSADTLVPWSSSVQIEVSAGDILTIEVMRDSSGDNSGGLFSATPTDTSWAIAPSASIQIYKIT